MDDSYRELTNRLFATATAMLEDAIEHAVAGQSAKHSPRQLLLHAERLQQAAREIAVIADACAIVARLASAERRNRPKPKLR